MKHASKRVASPSPEMVLGELVMARIPYAPVAKPQDLP